MRPGLEMRYPLLLKAQKAMQYSLHRQKLRRASQTTLDRPCLSLDLSCWPGRKVYDSTHEDV